MQLTGFQNLNSFSWLQDWYARHCDGVWEHSWGVSIDTLDNPGWKVAIDLIGTDLSKKSFKQINLERSPIDWIHCRVNDLRFEVTCGPRNLEEALEIFQAFASS
jgi:Immunity protein 53